MTIIKCKMCGGNMQTDAEMTYGTCEHCGSTMTLPKVTDDRKANLFGRADHFRRQNEFDKAIQAYENILNEDNTDAEAHWGLVLSKYGIEYVEDPKTGRRIPTCHRVQGDSILADADYLSALEYASDAYTRSLYEEEARRISEYQKNILAISSKEEPYDVFICYKEKDDNSGKRTKDSVLAQDLYNQLEKEGFRVFFSRITLEGKLGQQYEPYIYSALNSAKVMLAIGTKPEYFNAVWVKNEWGRFLALTKKDSAKLLIPCYRDMDAYDLPEELAMLQSQDMGRIGFAQDILHGIKKVVDGAKPDSPQDTAPARKASGKLKAYIADVFGREQALHTIGLIKDEIGRNIASASKPIQEKNIQKPQIKKQHEEPPYRPSGPYNPEFGVLRGIGTFMGISNSIPAFVMLGMGNSEAAAILVPISIAIFGIVFVSYAIQWGREQSRHNREMSDYNEEVRQYNQRQAENENKYRLALDKANKEYQAALENAKKQKEIALEKQTIVMDYLKNELAETDSAYKETKTALDALYSQNIIFGKYRNIVAMASICEYFQSGLCDSLEGQAGAYSIYESGLRQNTIIGKLGDIPDIEQLRETQYVLYEALSKSHELNGSAQKELQSIVSKAKSASDSAEDLQNTIGHYTVKSAIAGYCLKENEENRRVMENVSNGAYA